jgi:hypothetical protein
MLVQLSRPDLLDNEMSSHVPDNSHHILDIFQPEVMPIGVDFITHDPLMEQE